jgi:hypothetical protein
VKFSEEFEITPGPTDDWFDPILTVDDLLFIDPFLLYADRTNGKNRFKGGYDEVVTFFDTAFNLVKQSKGNRSSPFWKKAFEMLRLPEVEELCLGYTAEGTWGEGRRKRMEELVANAMTELIKRALAAGIKSPKHFEELCILGEGIASDRVSDMTASIIRQRLADYTKKVCDDHKIPLHEFTYDKGRYDAATGKWKSAKFKLPKNRYNQKAILLVPQRYLRERSTINYQDFWRYCWEIGFQNLSRLHGPGLKRRAIKGDVAKFARSQAGMLADYIEYAEKQKPRPYDFQADPMGVVKWYDRARDYSQRYPLSLPIKSTDDFYTALDRMTDEFKKYVEEHGGWELFWKTNYATRSERAAQRVLLGILKHYCRENGITIAREAVIGRRGNIFTADGREVGVFMALRLVRNTRFWKRLETQLTNRYRQRAITRGYIIAVAYTPADLRRFDEIQRRVREAARAAYPLKCVVVNALRRP